MQPCKKEKGSKWELVIIFQSGGTFLDSFDSKER